MGGGWVTLYVYVHDQVKGGGEGGVIGINAFLFRCGFENRVG